MNGKMENILGTPNIEYQNGGLVGVKLSFKIQRNKGIELVWLGDTLTRSALLDTLLTPESYS